MRFALLADCGKGHVGIDFSLSKRLYLHCFRLMRKTISKGKTTTCIDFSYWGIPFWHLFQPMTKTTLALIAAYENDHVCIDCILWETTVLTDLNLFVKTMFALASTYEIGNASLMPLWERCYFIWSQLMRNTMFASMPTYEGGKFRFDLSPWRRPGWLWCHDWRQLCSPWCQPLRKTVFAMSKTSDRLGLDRVKSGGGEGHAHARQCAAGPTNHRNKHM